MMEISELNLFEIDREINLNESKILFKPILSNIRDNHVVDRVFEEFKPRIVLYVCGCI